MSNALTGIETELKGQLGDVTIPTKSDRENRHTKRATFEHR